ncbi:DNA alkylation repair protein [Thorsellia kenyensis]|uniref:DNA alkylation repair protein n=1 Tax=Thorsellia kenyensis TaxID=1549888 RepID=A0ABV6C8Z6_9GAMM
MQRLDKLNQGLESTTHLQECLQINQEFLFKSVIAEFCEQSSLNEMLIALDKNSTEGILSKMKGIGKVLADAITHGNITNEAYAYLSKHPSDTVRGWVCFSLAFQTPDLSVPELLDKIKLFAIDNHFGVREWAWMAIREKLALELTTSIKLLSPWVEDLNPLMRRFAVECLRPRGVWCKHIAELKKTPQMALIILEPLKNEPEKYVQDSVANWLNDASKSSPSFVFNLCSRWLTESETPYTQRIVKQALRTINKKFLNDTLKVQ